MTKGLLFALILLVAIAAILTGGTFLSERNLINLARQVSINGILAVGMTAVILIGGIDLSVGSVAALTGIIAALTQGLGTPVSIMLTLVAGLLIGLWNGMLITRFHVPAFIITLGMMTMARGAALVLTGGVTLSSMNESFVQIGQAYFPLAASVIFLAALALLPLVLRGNQGIKSSFFTTLGICAVIALFWKSGKGIPVPVAVFAACACGGALILNHTVWGRYLYAVGGNPQAAHLSGIPVKAVWLGVFGGMGLLSSLAGIVLSARLAAAAPTAGNYFELDAIASVVIGGTSLSGGEGSIGRTVIGCFIIGILNNALSLMNVETNFQYIVKGALITAAVMLDRRRMLKSVA